MRLRVRLSRAATDDLASIAGWITREAGADVANAYTDRISARCEALAEFPRRGRLRHKGGSVRSIAFHRNATILYRVSCNEVLILRILHAGRDVVREVAGLR